MTMKRLTQVLVFWLSGFALIPVLQAQIPDPLRLAAPIEPAWKGMLQVFEKRNLTTETEDRVRGLMVTEYREYSSGPMTESHIAKIGTRPRLADAQWIKVKYRLEVEFQVIESRTTLVGASSTIKALKRDFLGTENWVDIASNGELERDLLTEFGKELFGERFQLPTRKRGFWERDPKYVPGPEEQIPKVVGPERPAP
jgi:hypothetical protein